MESAPQELSNEWSCQYLSTIWTFCVPPLVTEVAISPFIELNLIFFSLWRSRHFKQLIALLQKMFHLDVRWHSQTLIRHVTKWWLDISQEGRGAAWQQSYESANFIKGTLMVFSQMEFIRKSSPLTKNCGNRRPAIPLFKQSEANSGCFNSQLTSLCWLKSRPQLYYVYCVMWWGVCTRWQIRIWAWNQKLLALKSLFSSQF
jgi:hypothetical protein